MKKRVGRPSSFTLKVAQEICDRISEGETLRSICRDDGMPKWQTVYRWMGQRKEFAARIARARELGHDAIAEEALEIADTPLEGVRTEKSADGTKEVREDMLGHRKLQVHTRMQLLAKWNPKKYGDKQDINLSGQLDLASAILASRKRSGTK